VDVGRWMLEGKVWKVDRWKMGGRWMEVDIGAMLEGGQVEGGRKVEVGCWKGGERKVHARG
jgi:hypothetical protein